MTIDSAYLTYPQRRHGMDHDRYGWSDLFERAPVQWPNQARVALWVTPILQWFPLNAPAKPFRAPGGLTMPYPDFRHYTSRDYGNRIGIFRILRILADLGVPASVALNAAIAQRYPALLDALLAQKAELIAHGKDMGHLHHAELAREQEHALVQESLSVLRQASGQPVDGWLSPGRSQSSHTPDLLTQEGVRYCCDWANDDMPYAMRTTHGDLHAMPMAFETDDRVIFQDLHQNEQEWLVQIKDRFDVLYRESQQYGGRIMSLPLHAWLAGVPYRVAVLREALEYMLGHSGVWAATGGEILSAFQTQGR